ncbi:head maturation protease, ClpP-related [Fictibacillus fluitans]|uniref:ATP-dependent Clp protease proteolytic subunit n=1 Tax=Fictibacillus fluitans TaxID=3058422 RepID=A0ABT8HX22_9BACL|nr:head maturation protease, ClpP-related [Fictibacillus sp. NE201]MDN4525328.1 Clp protease ClpP [Fictibacillus sp. NE201]
MRHKVNIKGAIIPSDVQWIYDLFGMEATSPLSVSKEIETADGSDLEVIINSGGGSVHAGSEIYTMLMDYAGDVESKIVGMAASAASVIAMAGRVKMSPTAQMMVHNSSTINQGDYRSMDKASQMLQVVNKTIANAYRIKSGMSDEDIKSMMDEETWLTPQDALEKGLIDEIMFEDQVKFAASSGPTNLIPEEVINGIRNGMLKQQDPAAAIPQANALTEETVKKMFAEFKEEMLNSIKPEEQPKPEDEEPTQNDSNAAQAAKNHLRGFFLNL